MNGKQLKNSILQWAIQGKLVPQDASDEPAIELLKRINPKFTQPEYDEELPEGWSVATLSDICDTINGLWKGKKEPFMKVGVIRNANFTKDFKLDYSKIEYLDVEEKSFKKRNLLNGDLIVEKSGGGEKTPVGRSILYEGEDGIYSFSNFTMLLRIKDKKEILPKYLYYFLLSTYWSGAMFDMQTNTTGLHNLLTDIYLSIKIPLPPLAEQKRIVAKIEELMPLVERYTKAQEGLDKLNMGIKGKLRASILQEAIQGKLVPQDASDEPAIELLMRLNPKVKPITEDVPFEVPKSWVWCSIGDIGKVCSARRVHQKDWRKSGIPFYRAREIGKLAEYGCVNNELYIDKELYESLSVSGIPRAGDLMITAVGTLGKVYIVQKNDVFYYKDASVICLENRHSLCSEYIKLVIESPFFVEQFTQNSQGTTVGTLTMIRFNKYFFPLPPLAEQERIVAKLEELFGVLGRL